MIMKKFTLLFCALFIINICYAQQICGVCGGRGALICSTCRGTGQVVQTFYHPYFGYQNTNVLCPSCGGGTFVACHNCGGQGQINGITFKGDWIDVRVKVNGCRGGRYHGLCSCKEYVGKRKAGLNQYSGDCARCGHGPEYHGLTKY